MEADGRGGWIRVTAEPVDGPPLSGSTRLSSRLIIKGGASSVTNAACPGNGKTDTVLEGYDLLDIVQ